MNVHKKGEIEHDDRIRGHCRTTQSPAYGGRENMVSFTLRALQQARKADFETLSAELRECAATDTLGTKSSEIIKEFLNDEDFHITEYGDYLGGAFTAEWGEGSPVIGFLAEFNCHPDAEDGDDFRGSGRDIQTSAVMEAAVLTAEDLKRNDSEGTVVLYFCPSSRNETEKTLMADEGLFDTAEIALSWQPYTESGIIGSIPAGAEVTYTFETEESAEEFSLLTGEISEKAGDTGNIIPDITSSTVTCSVTAVTVPLAKKILSLLSSEAERIAESRKESVSTMLVKACSNMIVNNTLSSVMRSNAGTLFPISYSRDELSSTTGNTSPDGVPAVSTSFREDYITLTSPKDLGSVSRVLPTASIAVACYTPLVEMDTAKSALQSGSNAAMKSMHTASAVMAATAIDAVRDPSILEKAIEDLKWELRLEKTEDTGKIS